MRNLGSKLDYAKADEFFKEEEKSLLLKIPHIVENMEKISSISFKSIDRRCNYLDNILLVEVKEELTAEERQSIDYIRCLMETNYFNSQVKTGLFIKTYHGSQLFDILKALIYYDEKNGLPLLNEYYESAVNCKDIQSIEDIFVKQIREMQEYLKDNNIGVEDYKVDLKNHEDYSLLVEKYGDSKHFPEYNDLDYTPMLLDGDYCILDVSSDTMFVVKEDQESTKIYHIGRDRLDSEDLESLDDDEDESFIDFFYSHYQSEIELKKKLSYTDLIVEIKDGKFVKASTGISNLHLLQSFIVSELVNTGYIY
jgi:hypothetical protein